jgi:hypothetical protein
MNAKFAYDDIVKVGADAPKEVRPGEKAWIVGIFQERPGTYFRQFPEGVVYTIEFEDGASVEVHEMHLESV